MHTGKGKAAAAKLDRERWPEAEPLSDLPRRHTRVLLQELRRMRIRASQYDVADRDGKIILTSPEEVADWIEDQEYEAIYGVSPHEAARARDAEYVGRLKAELAKRPHIPNKPEARALRQAKAKEQRTR